MPAPAWVMGGSLLTVWGNASTYAPFVDPSSLTGLILWLDASKIRGIGDGGVVSVWTDSSDSASHATQPSAASQPRYSFNAQNGLGAVSFDTGQKAFLRSATSVLQSYTYATAVMSRATTGNHCVVADGTNSPVFDNGTNYGTFSGTTLTGSAFTSGAWVTLISQVTGSNTTFTVSGVTAAGNAGTGTGTLLNIGSLSAAAQYLNGSIGEIAVYNRIVTESERSTLNAYLKAKWATL